jgi:hypothetical protein
VENLLRSQHSHVVSYTIPFQPAAVALTVSCSLGCFLKALCVQLSAEGLLGCYHPVHGEGGMLTACVCIIALWCIYICSETRTAGTAINTFTNLLMTFVVGQTFLSMLCAMKFGVSICWESTTVVDE